MTTNADLVQVAVTGALYLGAVGSTLPTNALAGLPAGFDEIGYLTEDGVRQNIAAEITDIKAWQNADVVRRVRTSHLVTYAFAALETNEIALEAYYGNGSVTGDIDTGAVVEVKGDMNTRGPWVFDVVDGDDLIRVVLPDGEVSERGETAFVNGNAITYPMTITAYPDENDVKAYLYIAHNTSS